MTDDGTAPARKPRVGARIGRFLRGYTRGSIAVAVLVLLASLNGYVSVLIDPYTDDPWFALGIVSPVAIGLFFTIESLWRGGHWATGVSRAMGRGGVLVLVIAVIEAAVGVTLTLEVDQGDREPALGGAVGQAFLGFGLIGYAALLGGVIAGLLLVVLPFLAAFRAGSAEGVLPVADEREIARNRAAIITLDVVLILTFAVPSFVVFGDRYDNPTLVAVGWALLPLGLLAVVVTIALQRGTGLRRNLERIRRGERPR